MNGQRTHKYPEGLRFARTVALLAAAAIAILTVGCIWGGGADPEPLLLNPPPPPATGVAPVDAVLTDLYSRDWDAVAGRLVTIERECGANEPFPLMSLPDETPGTVADGVQTAFCHEGVRYRVGHFLFVATRLLGPFTFDGVYALTDPGEAMVPEAEYAVVWEQDIFFHEFWFLFIDDQGGIVAIGSACPDMGRQADAGRERVFP